MQVVVSLEYRFDRTPDGKVWTQTTFPYSFWTRYLEVFDRVSVVARVRNIASVPSDWQRADGEGVSFVAIPYYIGPWQYLRKARQVKAAARNAVGPHDAVILRLSSQIGSCIQPMLHKLRHPYGVEIVSDPEDVFAPGSIKHPLRIFFRWWFPRDLRRECQAACAAAYVTKEALQRRYPCPHLSVGVSDVEIFEEARVAAPRPPRGETGSVTLLFVGSLAQLYKAPNILIEAVAICRREGLNIKLVMVGDGQYKAELKKQAQALDLEKEVSFLGQLPAGNAVRAQFDLADLFILPSYQEGLPRAMVEAMARALPCIGSTVGGIPELLPAEDMVPPGDAAALANKIREVVTDPDRMAQMSARNLEKAKEYTDEVLRKQRLIFYRYVREQTEAWLKEQQNR
ncbi:MAG: glycosyltransferase family 4 protein [Oscillatoriaceae cyanobacterium Prado104]|jgi:glycosyltransferase involved in cell wall biosynthesis|nr:glycosyltransferase family 4 protein [Oscillatoriaceae cyanobacterium Prado104]